MGRTIALKLTQKEEEIITQINKQGITNSELLRNALRHYFEILYETTSPYSRSHAGFSKEEPRPHTETASVQTLKEEVQELRQHVHTDITRLQRQVNLLSLSNQPSNNTTPVVPLDIPRNIDSEVDEFLKKRRHQVELWRK